MPRRPPIQTHVVELDTPMSEAELRRWARNYLVAFLESEGIHVPPHARTAPQQDLDDEDHPPSVA